MIETEPSGPIGCVVCAALLDLEGPVIDCGIGPEHEACHADDTSADLPAVHVLVASC